MEVYKRPLKLLDAELLKNFQKGKLFDEWLKAWLKRKRTKAQILEDDIRTQRVNRVIQYLKVDLNKFKNIIHITGSTGKGTTSIILGAILHNLGYKTAVITKPHLAYSTERCIIEDRFIPETIQVYLLQKLTKINKKILKPSKLGELKYVEIMFLANLLYLYENSNRLDYVIIEAGTGIKNDYTNIFRNHQNYYKIITKIAYNHTKRLGNSLQQIFDNKNHNCQYTKKTIFLFPDEKIKIPKCNDQFIPLNADGNYKIYTSITGSAISYKDSQLTIYTNLITRVHVETLAKSFMALQFFDDIKNKIRKIENKETDLKIYINMPARFMPYRFKNKIVAIIDNAHSIDQYKELSKNLKGLKSEFKLNLRLWGQFYGSKRQNDAIQLFKKMHIPFNTFRIIPPRGIHLTEDIKNAPKFNQRFIESLDKRDLHVFTGSVYSIGQILKILNYNTNPYQKDAINTVIYYQKELIRFLYKNRRQVLQDKEYKYYSQKYLHTLEKQLEKYLITIDTVIGFIPMKRELNIVPFIKNIENIVLPRFNQKLKLWQLAYIKSLNTRDTQLFESYKHTPQPSIHNIKDGQIFSNLKVLLSTHKNEKILLLLPGLVFDIKGNRIGYGGGVYDQFLRDTDFIYIDSLYNQNPVILKKEKQLTKKLNTRSEIINAIDKLQFIVMPVRYPWERSFYVVDFIMEGGQKLMN